jgi:hypothetical protein
LHKHVGVYEEATLLNDLISRFKNVNHRDLQIILNAAMMSAQAGALHDGLLLSAKGHPSFDAEPMRAIFARLQWLALGFVESTSGSHLSPLTRPENSAEVTDSPTSQDNKTEVDLPVSLGDVMGSENWNWEVGFDDFSDFVASLPDDLTSGALLTADLFSSASLSSCVGPSITSDVVKPSTTSDVVKPSIMSDVVRPTTGQSTCGAVVRPSDIKPRKYSVGVRKHSSQHLRAVPWVLIPVEGFPTHPRRHKSSTLLTTRTAHIPFCPDINLSDPRPRSERENPVLDVSVDDLTRFSIDEDIGNPVKERRKQSVHSEVGAVINHRRPPKMACKSRIMGHSNDYYYSLMPRYSFY